MSSSQVVTVSQPADPTICDPESRRAIAEHHGVDVRTSDPQVLAFVVANLRSQGNEAFKRRFFKDAVKLYSQAIAGAEEDWTLFGNRSAAFLEMGCYEEALYDASKSVKLNRQWPKGYYRLGSAYLAISQYQRAVQVLEMGLKLEPSNKELAAKLKEAQWHIDDERAKAMQVVTTERRQLVRKLQQARRQDSRLAMINQWKQAMVGPQWEAEDYEWRPTWQPIMKLRPLERDKFLADPKHQGLLQYCASLAELAAPKRMLPILSDNTRLDAYEAGVKSALQHLPGAHVLVLSAGTGILGLVVAGAGAGRVSLLERSRHLFRMARLTLDDNCDAPEVALIHLVESSLKAVGIAGEELPPDIVGALQAAERQASAAPEEDDVSSVDSGEERAAEARAAVDELLAAEEKAGHPLTFEEVMRQKAAAAEASREAAAAAPEAGSAGSTHDDELVAATGTVADQSSGAGAVALVDSSDGQQQEPQSLEELQDTIIGLTAVLPERVEIIVTDMFDYSCLGMGVLPALDYAAERLLKPGGLVVPSTARVRGMLLELQLTDVSGFDLSYMNVYRWHPHIERINLDRLQHKPLSEPFDVISLDLQQRVDALAAAGLGGVDLPTPIWESDTTLQVPVTASGRWNAVAFWFELQMAPDTWLASWREPGRGLPVGSSWGQGLHYIDGIPVEQGGVAGVRVRQDTGHLNFAAAGAPSLRPRHNYLARWHFDMLADTQRNDAYQKAIQHALDFKRGLGCDKPLVLDIGAGSGLLSMMAARAGADQVIGAEMSKHMCDVGVECVVMNGLWANVMLLDKDVRRMDIKGQTKQDCTAPDLERRADMLVFEVFDCGLIGEGVLHSTAHAHLKLLADDATLVPSAANVFCQPLQLRRVSRCRGYDVQQTNRYHWRPDYEGIELPLCKDEWVALGPVVPAMDFDFYDFRNNMQPTQIPITFRFDKEGIWNATAFWFDLHLDEDTSLTSSPYGDKGATWEQAVQWMDEVIVEPGLKVSVLARHDTYGISFAVDPEGKEELKPRRSPVPFADMLWLQTYAENDKLNGELAKAIIQNPLEFRSVAKAAVAIGSRPHDLGLEAEQASDFCTRLMS